MIIAAKSKKPAEIDLLKNIWKLPSDKIRDRLKFNSISGPSTNAMTSGAASKSSFRIK